MTTEAESQTNTNIIRYSTLAASVFAVYDTLLVFHYEIEFIWQAGWSSAKYLYIWNRYFGLVTVIFSATVSYDDSLKQKMGVGFAWWAGLTAATAIFTVELILLYRIYAIYARNKLLLAFTGFTFLVTVVITVLLFTKNVIKIESISISGGYIVLWIPSFIFETFLCSLMLFKAWKLHRRERRSPLVYILVRDSVLYFLTFFVVMSTNCAGWALRPEASLFGVNWVVAVPCVLGSRILLNMNERYVEEKAAVLECDAPCSDGEVEVPVFSTVIDWSGFQLWSHASRSTD